jgi:glycosyltransferase involved in cell wall biosynthesis
MAANSSFVAERLRKIHRREARVIHPPVSIAPFIGQVAPRGDYYVTVGRLVPYKRVDLLAQAFAAMPGRRLKIIGAGPEHRRIAALAGPNVELLGHLPTPEVRAVVARAKAFLFAGIEDFGIAPVEAQAAGTPVIAYAAGGLGETVVTAPHARPTGLLFAEQSPRSLIAAIDAFEASPERFTAANARANAALFSEQRFRDSYRDFVTEAIERRGRARPGLAQPATRALWPTEALVGETA